MQQALERQLVDGATSRADASVAVVRPATVRQVLDRHPSAGEDQAAMVRDLTQGGAGVAVVVGRAGSGKTWALGLAREAFELDGYQVLGTAPPASPPSAWPTRLHRPPHGGSAPARPPTPQDGAGRPVGAGGGRGRHARHQKAGSSAHHAEQAGAKVVLVSDDRQFASIQAAILQVSPKTVAHWARRQAAVPEDPWWPSALSGGGDPPAGRADPGAADDLA